MTKLILTVFAAISFMGLSYLPSNPQQVRNPVVATTDSLLSEQAEWNEWYEQEVIPVADFILATGMVKDTAIVPVVATSVVEESARHGINPLFVASVIRIENPWLVPDTASHAGAVGIMQIMPVWQDSFTHCGTNHRDIHTNICKGVEILMFYLDRSYEAALDRALLRYNGCVRNPTCASYAEKVGGDFSYRDIYMD